METYIIEALGGPMITNNPQDVMDAQAAGNRVHGPFMPEVAQDKLITLMAGGDVNAPTAIGSSGPGMYGLNDILGQHAPRVQVDMDPSVMPGGAYGGQNNTGGIPGGMMAPQTPMPSPMPTQTPTPQPTGTPSASPTPTQIPTQIPTQTPAPQPTGTPSASPTTVQDPQLQSSDRVAPTPAQAPTAPPPVPPFDPASATPMPLDPAQAAQEPLGNPMMRGIAALGAEVFGAIPEPAPRTQGEPNINPALFPELMTPEGEMRDLGGVGMGGDPSDPTRSARSRNVYDDLNPYDPFSGTWAAGSGDMMMQSVLGGNMTPDQAVYNIIGTQGYDQYAFSDTLEDQYTSYMTLYNMMNPGQMLDYTDQYAFGGQHVLDMMQPVGNGGMIPDYRGAWDMQFSPESMDYVTELGLGDAGQSEYQMVMGNIQNGLSPYVSSDQLSVLMQMTDRAFKEYTRQIGTGGLPPDTGFIQYLQSIGAGDWF